MIGGGGKGSRLGEWIVSIVGLSQVETMMCWYCLLQMKSLIFFPKILIRYAKSN